MRSLTCTFLLFTVFSLIAVSPAQQAPTTAVPNLINYSGTLALSNNVGMPAKTVGVTFAIYRQQDGGAPIWLETQNVTPDSTGRYTVLLGSTKADGIPADLFSTQEQRWLGVQMQGQAEQPRVLLVSVPYAMKAADAETVGGLPASAFVLATPPSANPAIATIGSEASGSASPPTSSNVTTTGGTANTIPMFTTATNIQNSILTQTGTTAVNVGGKLNLPATGTATLSKGFNSRPGDFVASVFNSGTSTAVPQTFQWQAEPVNNNKTTASGTLNLLFGQGTSMPTETGFKISNKGIITFAAGQTLPTVTGNEMVEGNLSATGSVSGASANFTGNVSTGNQTVTGNITDSGSISASGSISGATAAFSGNNTTQIVRVTQSGTGDALAARATNHGAAVSAISNNGVSVVGLGLSGGVSGEATANTGSGVTGWSIGSRGIGVFGFEPTLSSTANSLFGNVVTGVWGDVNQGSNTGEGVLATADDTVAIFGQNNSGSLPTAKFLNVSSEFAPVFEAEGPSGNGCGIDGHGDLTCTGSKSAVVPVERGQKMVALYAVEAPENWFEDFGSGQLTNGVATVALEGTYVQTVNTSIEYHVFLTPRGDCNGLYVTNETAASFEVRELHGGRSSAAFDYRIVAKRTGYEQIRLADKTTMIKQTAMLAASRGRTKLDTPPQQIAPPAPR